MVISHLLKDKQIFIKRTLQRFVYKKKTLYRKWQFTCNISFFKFRNVKKKQKKKDQLT